MLLAVDVGNSNIVFGVWDNEEWRATSRIDTHGVEQDRYKKELNQLINSCDAKITEIMVSSVVPEVIDPLTSVLKNTFQTEINLLDASFNLGISIQTKQPEKVGTDLIADAEAAYHLIQDRCIVVDFGTATTVMAINEKGNLLGVAICTGLRGAKQALTGAAQLFDVPLQAPPSVLGGNTIEAMQSGLVVGHVAMVEGLVARMRKEMGSAQVIATGGFAERLDPLTDLFDVTEPLLTLDGLRLIAERQPQNEPQMARGKQQSSGK